MNLTYRSFCKYCGEKVFIATIRSKSQIATLESPFLVLLGEEPEKSPMYMTKNDAAENLHFGAGTLQNRRNGTMHDTALLAWVKSEEVFLKIQPGTGDNLLREDIRAGYVDYYLWSTFRPECIDIDGELDMDCLDSGMFLFTESPGTKAALQSCYKEAFGKEYDESDTIVLLEE